MSDALISRGERAELRRVQAAGVRSTSPRYALALRLERRGLVVCYRFDGPRPVWTLTDAGARALAPNPPDSG